MEKSAANLIRSLSQPAFGLLKKTGIILLVLLLFMPQSIVHSTSLVLTLVTDKQAYSLGDKVHISGQLKADGNPVSDGLITIQVNDPQGDLLVIRVRPTGNVTKSWRMEITDVNTIGGTGTPTEAFYRGDYIGFNVTVKNNDLFDNVAIITVNAYYSNGVPFGSFIMWSGTLEQNKSTTVMSTPVFQIPSDAPFGTAVAYVNVLTSLPEAGGYAYGPENFVTFEITSGTSLPPSPPPSSPLVNGAYNLTVAIPFVGARLGNYTTYVSTFYDVAPYRATNSTIFEVVLIGDLNGDKLCDIDDVIIVALAYASLPGDPRWNPIADLSGDGIIDIDDVILVALDFGKIAS
jgi:hypothetical protein